MSKKIHDVAADPYQWDLDDVVWENEGRKDSPNRRLFLEYLRPALVTVKGKRVLHLGCGQGWLCGEIAGYDGVPLGLDPSVRNMRMARENNPALRFVRASLQDFMPDERYHVIFAIMVLEYFLDIEAAFKRVASLLEPGGHVFTIVSDFERSTRSGVDYKFESEALSPDEIAIRITSVERFGVMCDIVRTIERYGQAAGRAKLALYKHEPILPQPWHPRYDTHRDRPLFHLLEYVKEG
jgi:cyclopropane fatty-acyl-phospholipid synthase-like methyltransferase